MILRADPQALSSRARDLLAMMLMWAAVAAVYWWPKETGGGQLASDYYGLHIHRMTFAREMLASQGALPGWYPRELLGTPFWSNIQSFPFIPTRLLLLTFDPAGPYTYTLAITLAAILAATFTYLFARRIGIGPAGSAAAGWTFACCGYFASRIAAGHLPLLEVYCALPLLLWCVESLAQARESGRPVGRWIVTLGLSSIGVMLAGHPQLPVYALTAAGLYALWRMGLKRSFVPFTSMGLGIGCASFALVPMAMLIGRSTRVLPLARAGNDLALPYRRLAGFFFPWLDGAAVPLSRAAHSPFAYPDVAFFWDTFCYAGWTPWIAAVLLLVLVCQKRLRFSNPGAFILAMGLAGIVLALPIVQQISAMIPGTFLRSPARLLYLTEFALAMGLGAAVHFVLRQSTAAWLRAAVAIALIAHAIDVGRVSREFDVRTPGGDTDRFERAIAPALETVRDGRIAMDMTVSLPSNRRHDDVGFFDSIILARPYALMMDLSGAPIDLNEQQVDGSLFSPRALEAAGVKFIFTFNALPQLTQIGPLDKLNAYMTANPASRAAFFPLAQVAFVEDRDLRTALRDPATDVSKLLVLPGSVAPPPRVADISNEPAQVRYSRISPDRIECSVIAGQAGYLRIIESWDPGWSATVDGTSTPIVPALGALLAVPLSPGMHQVTVEYRTPGARLGMVLSAISLLGLIVFAWWTQRSAIRPVPSPHARGEGARSEAEH